VKPSSGWATTSSFTAKLTASDGAAGDFLGNSVGTSSDGSTIVAGAPKLLNFLSEGAAYVFVKPSSGWATATETAKLTASDGAAKDNLGNSVGTNSDGSTIVAGALGATIGSNLRQGAAYVFVKPSSGWATTTESAKLTASDGAAQNTLGWSVGLSGDGSTIVAGAPGATIGSSTSQGAAFFFALPFSAFSAKLAIQSGAPPGFDLNGSFTLGTGSNGIQPLNEPMTLQIGTSSITIPAGSFQKNAKGRFVFQGVINSVNLQAQIVPLGSKASRSRSRVQDWI
jgi:hypothetical protein